MGYLPPVTIAETIRRIQKGELILPAIQREYVWKHTQVVALFDSIMRGYPIGGFLSWKAEPETVMTFRFYGFLKDFSEFNGKHNPGLDLVPGQTVTAMLDGQQRLTSLNIGLRGTYAYRKPRAWASNAVAYPVRELYLNVLGEAEDNEAGLRYDFRFLTKDQVTAAEDDASKYWFPVREVFSAEKMHQVWTMAAQRGLANNGSATDILGQLWEAIHATQSLHFYEETEQDVERVLDIFIRVNSQGTVLSYSDLLLSIATAQWKERDARQAIHGLVDMLNGPDQRFRLSQDVVLKSGLVLSGVADIAFKVRNFTAENMATLDKNWDSISDSLNVAVGLLSDFGLSDATLTADSVLIPVAYYVHQRGLGQTYRTAVKHAEDRKVLRSWVLRSLIIPGVWGSGLDTLLRDLRQLIQKHGGAGFPEGFPVIEIEARMAARGKSLAMTDGQIEDLLNLSYGKPRTFAVLALLFPHVDTKNVHHVDHVYPRSLLQNAKLAKAGLDAATAVEFVGKRDLLPNLQLLDGPMNLAKSDKVPAEWAAGAFPNAVELQAYLHLNRLPTLPSSAQDFSDFINIRRKNMADLIKERFTVALSPVTSTIAATDESVIPSSIDDEPTQEDLAE